MILGLRAFKSSTTVLDADAAASQHSLPSDRAIQLTSPFGLNTILEAFQQPLYVAAVPAEPGYPLSDMQANASSGHV